MNKRSSCYQRSWLLSLPLLAPEGCGPSEQLQLPGGSRLRSLVRALAEALRSCKEGEGAGSKAFSTAQCPRLPWPRSHQPHCLLLAALGLSLPIASLVEVWPRSCLLGGREQPVQSCQARQRRRCDAPRHWEQVGGRPLPHTRPGSRQACQEGSEAVLRRARPSCRCPVRGGRQAELWVAVWREAACPAPHMARRLAGHAAREPAQHSAPVMLLRAGSSLPPPSQAPAAAGCRLVKPKSSAKLIPGQVSVCRRPGARSVHHAGDPELIGQINAFQPRGEHGSAGIQLVVC